MSTADVCGRPSADSGATYAGVPTNSWVRVRPGESASRAMPKSVSIGCMPPHVLLEQDVRGLQVAVHDAVGVAGGERVGDLGGQEEAATGENGPFSRR